MIITPAILISVVVVMFGSIIGAYVYVHSHSAATSKEVLSLAEKFQVFQNEVLQRLTRIETLVNKG